MFREQLGRRFQDLLPALGAKVRVGGWSQFSFRRRLHEKAITKGSGVGTDQSVRCIIAELASANQAENRGVNPG
jgi:hypothetical protein